VYDERALNAHQRIRHRPRLGVVRARPCLAPDDCRELAGVLGDDLALARL
jgi:hypothetical protein